MKTKGDPVIKTFATEIRRARYRMDKSQEELALDLSIHVNTLGLIERGEQNPNLTLALKISKALHISLDELLRHIVDDLDI